MMVRLLAVFVVVWCLVTATACGADGGCAQSLEFLLADAEAASAIAASMGRTYPAEKLERLRRQVEAAGSDSVELRRFAEAVLEDALTYLAARVSTRGLGVPVVVFNPCSWVRTDSVSIRNPFPGESVHLRVTDPSGRVRAARAIGDSLQFTAQDVPALGYKVFRINRSNQPVANAVRADGSVLENDFFRVTLDPDRCSVSSLTDRSQARGLVVQPGLLFGALQIVRNAQDGLPGRTEDVRGPTDVIVINSGPARAVACMDSELGDSQFVQEFTLFDGIPRLDLRVTADWQPPTSEQSELRVVFDTGIRNGATTQNTLLRPRSHPDASEQDNSFGWIDVSGTARGISIFSDCALRFSAHEGIIQAALGLIAPGIREFTLSIYPHGGDWRAAGSVLRAYEINRPLRACLTGANDSDFPPSRSFVQISDPGVIVSSLRMTGDRPELVLTLQETLGRACRVRVRVNLPFKGFTRVHGSETQKEAVYRVEDGIFTIALESYETVVLKSSE